jgi:hypothetical protein
MTLLVTYRSIHVSQLHNVLCVSPHANFSALGCAFFGPIANLLGNTILVKLELWESVMVIIIFGLPLTYAYATLRQSVAGNSTFRGIVFCNLGTPKTVISNFVTSRQTETPYLSLYGYPNNVPGGQKNSRMKKTRLQQCINSLVSHKLSHNR